MKKASLHRKNGQLPARFIIYMFVFKKLFCAAFLNGDRFLHDRHAGAGSDPVGTALDHFDCSFQIADAAGSFDFDLAAHHFVESVDYIRTAV